jgi:pimeloyl-ACP methyl ester carboxylesterase
MPHVEGAGVALHYAECGAGPAVLVVHAMGSDVATWKPALEELAAAGDARAIAFDRRGYGSSGAPEPYSATTVQEQAQDAGALLAALDAAPAVLVGDGFGALVVLELLVRRPELARGVVLVDPPLHAFVPEATKALALERELLEEALREGGREAAVLAWLGEDVDRARAARAAAGHVGFFADYAGQASWSPSRRELRTIGAPVAVVTRPGAPAHIVAAADAVAALVPGARRVADGAVVAAALALL